MEKASEFGRLVEDEAVRLMRLVEHDIAGFDTRLLPSTNSSRLPLSTKKYS
jgi:hypothetical protein